VGAIVAVMTVAPDARAFCRQTTSPPTNPSFNPEPDCWPKGLPQFWPGRCVGYNIQSGDRLPLKYDDAAEIIARSFARWANATCPTDGTGRSRVSIDVRDLGPVACGKAGSKGGNKGSDNRNGPNQNVIAFRVNDWEYGDPELDGTLALTFTYFNKETGEIRGSDMVINNRGHTIVAGIPKADENDLESIMTHEAGHFLGLAHSADVNATMFYSYSKEQSPTSERMLGADDINGICDAYPPDGARPAGDGSATQPARPCDPTPFKGLISECPDTSVSACSRALQVAPQTSSLSGWLASGGAAASLFALRRWRRRRATWQGHGRSN